MCGIAGLAGPMTRSYGRQGLAQMLRALRHRGPDDEGIYEAAEALIGQRRLSIIDLASGRQPIGNEDGTKWIVCNGEIYNYQELRAELVAAGHRFATHSDTEVILHLYEDLGERCLDRLRGMFAFAIWDEEKRALFAARDHLGQKPFYFVHRGQQLAFASEIKALLAWDPSLGAMDLGALDQYLTLRIIAPPRSMFREIRKLAPAHALRFSAERGVQTWRYWNLDYEPKLEGSEDDLVDELEARLVECLRLHMVSDVPVGAFMSGGLDSTLIVAMLMKHVAQEPIRTFSMGLPYGQFDEAPYARMVANRYGTRHHEKVVRPSLIDTLPKVVWHLDEPSDPLSVCAYAIAQMASEHVKVVLGGDGGDELFGGYDRYYGNHYANRYAQLPYAVRRFLIGPILERIPDGGWYKSRSHQLKWLQYLSFFDGGKRYARSLGYFYFGPERKQMLYGEAMWDASTSFDADTSIVAEYEAAQAVHDLDRMLYADSQVRLPDHPVMILDRMTMAHGLEARSPFMDHELAEFAAKLPTRLKIRGRSLRYIQARLAKRYLPKEVLRRRKQGFSSALPYMLRDEYHVLYKLFLEHSLLSQAGIVNQGEVNNLLKEHEGGRVDHGNRLWLLLNSEVWYRMFVEGHSVHAIQTEIDARTRSRTNKKAAAQGDGRQVVVGEGAQ
jgi:asparagine synthase (glutamine-hydrolysing)